MWFNLMIRVKPYQLRLGVAWLSSARVVKCSAYSVERTQPLVAFIIYIILYKLKCKNLFLKFFYLNKKKFLFFMIIHTNKY